MSAGDAMPPDPFALEDGSVDMLEDGERLMHALLEAALAPRLETVTGALRTLDEMDLRSIVASEALRIAASVREARSQPRRQDGRLRRSVAAGIAAARR